MHGRLCTGNNRHVVGAGKTRHRAVGDGIESRFHKFLYVGDDAIFNTLFYVRWITAVNADNDHGLRRPFVRSPIECYILVLQCAGHFRLLFLVTSTQGRLTE